MLGIFAEFETHLRRERQREGIAWAKVKGAYIGCHEGKLEVVRTMLDNASLVTR